MFTFGFAQHAQRDVELLLLLGQQLSFGFSLPAVFFQRRNSSLEFLDASKLFLFSPAQTFDLGVEALFFLVL